MSAQECVDEQDTGYVLTVWLQGVVACLVRGETAKARQALASLTDEQRARAAEVAGALTEALRP